MAHWYRRDGESLYQINKVGSKEKRDTTLADARKLSLVPSVTTIMSVAAKDVLTNWLMKQVAEAALKNPKFRNEEDESYIKRLIMLSKEKGETAAKRGTELHDKLETYFLTGKIDPTDNEFIVPALNLLAYEFNGQKWIPEAGFAHKRGYGGKVDLHSKSGIIVDFKTKAKDELDKKSVYDDYCTQLAAYREGLDLPDAKCYNLIISTNKPGTLYLHKWSEEDLKIGLKKFHLLLDYWKLINKFDSGWEDEENSKNKSR